MKKRRVARCAAALILVVLLIMFSSPVQAIRLGAVLQGCEWDDVMSAEFEKREDISSITSLYEATNSVLADKLTGSGHQSWYVYTILFVNIPRWAGNG